MSVTKPTPIRRTAAPRRPSRVRIAAVWLALLLCSFLFGLLIISPLLGIVMSRSERGKPAVRKPGATAPAPRTSSFQEPRPQPSLRVEQNVRPRPLPGPGISLSPDDSESTVQAADPIEPMPQPEPQGVEPLPGRPAPTPSPTAVPPSGGLSVEENPVPNPQNPGGIQRGERID